MSSLNNLTNEQEFGLLFKKYRLKSEIESLSEFGDALAEEGVTYENSLFTRWQRGDRLPSKRGLLLKITTVFAKRGAFRSEEEINTFLSKANQPSLTEKEAKKIRKYFLSKISDTLPAPISTFVGREKIIKDIVWELVQENKVFIHGVPGVGKTALAIQIANKNQEAYSDGIFWFRVDIKGMDVILDEILTFFKVDTRELVNREEKLERIGKLLRYRKVLVILDNVEPRHMKSPVMKFFVESKMHLMLTAIHDLTEGFKLKPYTLECFTEQEYVSFAQMLLGGPFVDVNKEKIDRLGFLLGRLPILITLMLKQVEQAPQQIDDFISKIHKQEISLENALYDNKNLHASLNFVFSKLSDEEKEFVVACAVFDGGDFSLQAAAFANRKSINEAESLMKAMMSYSLVEPSINERYRLHPAIKMYLRKKLDKVKVCKRMVRYYVRLISAKRSNGERLFSLEIDNVLGIMDMSYKASKFSDYIDLWNVIKNKLWIFGRWEIVIKLEKPLMKAFKEMGDEVGGADYCTEHLSRVLFYLARYKKAVSLLYKGLEIVNKLGDEFRVGRIKQKFGFVEEAKGNHEKALDLLFSSVNIMNKYIDRKDKIAMTDLMKSHIFICKNYIALGTNDSYILKTLKYVLANKKKHYESGLAYVILGDFYCSKSKYSLAENNYLKGLVYEKGLRRILGIVDVYNKLGDVYLVQDMFKEAKKYYVKAEKIYSSLGMLREKQKVLKVLKKLSKKLCK